MAVACYWCGRTSEEYSHNAGHLFCMKRIEGYNGGQTSLQCEVPWTLWCRVDERQPELPL